LEGNTKKHQFEKCKDAVYEQGESNHSRVGDLGARPLPSSLIVESKKAGLYRRQDDETEKITELPQGDDLIPMAQTGQNWYLVKTKKGLIGWIRSSDVSNGTHK